MQSSKFTDTIKWDNEVTVLQDTDIIFALFKKGEEFVWAVLGKNGACRGVKICRFIPPHVKILNLSEGRPTEKEIIPLYRDPIESIMTRKPLIRRSDLHGIETEESK